MAATLITLDVRTREQWRRWLAKHHTSSPGIWLVRHKQHTGVKSMPYEDLVRAGALLRVGRQPRSNAWTTIAMRSKSRRASRRASGRISTADAGTNSRRPACLQRPASPWLPRRTGICRSPSSRSCQRTLPGHSRRSPKPGSTFKRLRRGSDVTSSCGFTRPSDPRRGNGAFANQLNCSRLAKSLD